MVNEDAIKAQYDKEYAGKPGETEVHARHILVDSEAKAKDVIKQLQGGREVRRPCQEIRRSEGCGHPAGRRPRLLQEGRHAAGILRHVAFKLKPNEYTKTPVHTRYGWHVIQVLETRTAQPPTYEAGA